MLSVAAGTLLRHPAAAIASLIAVLFVLPGIAQALPDSWRNPVTEFWPTQAGGQPAAAPGAPVSLPRPSTYGSYAEHHQDGKGSLQNARVFTTGVVSVPAHLPGRSGSRNRTQAAKSSNASTIRSKRME